MNMSSVYMRQVMLLSDHFFLIIFIFSLCFHHQFIFFYNLFLMTYVFQSSCMELSLRLSQIALILAVFALRLGIP